MGKPRMFKSVLNARPGVDIIFFHCPENLLVPGLSSLLAEVPNWNKDVEEEVLQSTFSFTAKHLQDHGCIVVFYLWNAKAKNNINGLY